jgi:hypothetical protein
MANGLKGYKAVLAGRLTVKDANMSKHQKKFRWQFVVWRNVFLPIVAAPEKCREQISVCEAGSIRGPALHNLFSDVIHTAK